MKPLTIVTPYSAGPSFEKTLLPLTRSDLVENVMIVSPEPVHFKPEKCHVFVGGPLTSYETLNPILTGMQTEYFVLLRGSKQISIEPKALEKILWKAESTKAGLIFTDFYDENERWKTFHPLIDYQAGSIRDDFDFGSIMLFSVAAVKEALEEYGPTRRVKFAGLYDLRLRVSIDHSIHHFQEPLYSVTGIDEPLGGEEIFTYVDPRNEVVQKEMEGVFTDYLKTIEAYLPAHLLREAEPTSELFAVEASVVIPVRNRKETISEAVGSALSQETNFPYNVIVVDNHSWDGTTLILSNLARRHPSLKHHIPKRTDLGIGGCWNEALQHEACGRYAVQLDSDDLYSGVWALQKMVDRFRESNYAMVIGSYTLVDSSLEEIPPGLIDHHEWTDENGHNNALRINGLGAPRAFNTDLMRKIGFLNVSYGEDYAAALRVCREYRIGRVYESLYLCRRWPGNTDAALSIEELNRNNAFKDEIRTTEILARKKIVRRTAHGHRVSP